MHTRISRKKSWFAVSAPLSALEVESKIVKNMELTLSNSSASSVVQLLNGSVGVIRISVSHVIKSNVVEITCQGNQKTNCQNALARLSAHSKLIIHQTEKNMPLDVVFVET